MKSWTFFEGGGFIKQALLINSWIRNVEYILSTNANLQCLSRLKEIEEEKEKVVKLQEIATKSQKEEIDKYETELKSLLEEKNFLIQR